ncbi:MAG: hypothetical protein BSOLF_2495 [Candidatus Carbobacillus altaicus]|uniref:Uncharacterized protein n=1 Tax=Candidatus Carbonibacillus altaicus TaxID=2163959 RepID=A0A2R6Y2M7_9BACL|nr:MAG: hypothetical protein BSOLF_2495 [Candidatus Carbobacillus altaicus]
MNLEKKHSRIASLSQFIRICQCIRIYCMHDTFNAMLKFDNARDIKIHTIP